MKIQKIHLGAGFGDEFKRDLTLLSFLTIQSIVYYRRRILRGVSLDSREASSSTSQNFINDGHSRKKKYDTDKASQASSALLVTFFLDFLGFFCILAEMAASWKG